MGGSVGIKYAKNAPDPTGGNSLHFPRPLTQGQMEGGMNPQTMDKKLNSAATLRI